jgi:hypothetical protein
MSRIPRPLAKKLDRLARRAHRFHRFAHHPLCAEYAGELVRLGRRGRVCRGCALAIAGAAGGAIAGMAAPMAADAAAAARACVVVLTVSSVYALALWVGLGARAPGTSSRARAPKALTRFLPLALFAFGCVFGARSGGVAGVLLCASSVGSVAALYRRYRARGPSRAPCTTCPERTLEAPCRGYAPIVRRERAFARVARRMVA